MLKPKKFVMDRNTMAWELFRTKIYRNESRFNRGSKNEPLSDAAIANWSFEQADAFIARSKVKEGEI